MTNKKRLINTATRVSAVMLTVLILANMLLISLPASGIGYGMLARAATEVASGECGDDLTWSLDSDGLLSITGTGAMRD